MDGLAMTLVGLRYLTAVADLQHFSRAAESCNVAQSSLSAQLQRLEERLGVPLIERTTRFVRLTPVGELVVAHARRIFEETDRIEQLAHERHGTLSSDLRLGVIPTLGPYILPSFLGVLRETYPQLQLVLREDLPANLIAALDAHALDVLLMVLPDHDSGAAMMPLFDEALCVACPAGHRFANQPTVTEGELAREKLLLLEEGHCLRDQTLALFGRQPHNQPTSRDDFRSTSLETICELVAAGFGCTLLPAMAVPHLTTRDKRLAVRPLRPARAHRRIGLVWRASFPRIADLEVLGRFIQDRAPDSVVPIRPKVASPAKTKRARLPRASA